MTPTTIPNAVHERAFLTWANTFLAKRRLTAKSTFDFENGLMLLNLLELVSGKAITRRFKFDLRPRARAGKISNVLFCLKFMEDEGMTTRGTTRVAEQIVDNDVPTVLSILWQLVVLYHLYPMFPYKKNYRTAFWTWAEKKMDYKLSASSWVSGEGFYYLCYAIQPHVMPPLQSIEGDLLGNMIDIMEKYFMVPSGFLSKNDFQNFPSDPPVLMVMVYLARVRIEQFREERKKMIAAMGTDHLCCLSTLPEELLMNVVNLMSDPLPWLFVNC